MRRAFLGAGLIGAAFVRAACSRGDAVRVWNRSPEKARVLEAAGAEACAELSAALAGAERVHLALSSDEALDAVLEQALPFIEAGAIILDHSTASPQGAARRAVAVRGAGYQLLAAPIFMSPEACLRSRGVMVVGGAEEAYELVADELAAMTGRVWYVGEDAARAAAFKLMGNAVILSLVGALADVFSMGRALGMDAEDCRGLFEVYDPRAVIAGRGARMARGDFDAAWTLDMARKDVGLMLDAAAGSAQAVLPGLARRMDALIAEGEGARDVGILARDALKTTKVREGAEA